MNSKPISKNTHLFSINFNSTNSFQVNVELHSIMEPFNDVFNHFTNKNMTNEEFGKRCDALRDALISSRKRLAEHSSQKQDKENSCSQKQDKENSCSQKQDNKSSCSQKQDNEKRSCFQKRDDKNGYYSKKQDNMKPHFQSRDKKINNSH